MASQVPDFKIKSEQLEPNKWTFLYNQTHVYTGEAYTQFQKNELQSLAEKKESTEKSDTPEKKVTMDVVSFEKSIITKPSKSEILFSEKEGFPNGWPEKWFFETPKYKYWTVVGEVKENQSTAMTSSAIKAQEILSKEFPLNSYKTIPVFETTHNQVKRILGQYQSWRIIRVQQETVQSLIR